MPSDNLLLAVNSLMKEYLRFVNRLTPLQVVQHESALEAVNDSIGTLLSEIATAESAGIEGSRKDIERMVGARIIKDALGIGELALSRIAVEQAEAELRALGVNPDDVRKDPLEGLDDIALLKQMQDELDAELLSKGLNPDDFDEAMERDL